MQKIKFIDPQTNDVVEFAVEEETTLNGTRYLLVSEGEESGDCEAYILKEVSRDMHEHVKYNEDMQKEYREYIEMWIHEIKTPIASSKLVIENNYNNDIVRKIDTQINKPKNKIFQKVKYFFSFS